MTALGLGWATVMRHPTGSPAGPAASATQDNMHFAKVDEPEDFPPLRAEAAQMAPTGPS